MVTILMMSAKLDTQAFVKYRYFDEKSYNVIISINNVTNKIFTSDSNYIVDVVT